MLSPTRYEERLRNLTPTARKVFDAVPISEPWSSTYIQSEMSRLGTRPGGTDILMGCLNSLKQAGLVEEPERGQFIRARVRPAKTEKDPQPAAEKAPMPTPQKPEAKPAAPTSAIDLLAGIAKSMRALAGEIETAALAIEEGQAKAGEEVQKLRQLQALLKGLA